MSAMRLGAATFVFVGLSHLLLLHLFAPAPTAAEAALDDHARRTSVTVLALTRDFLGINTAFSLEMGVMVTSFGVLVWLAAHQATRSFTVVCLLTALASLAVSAAYLVEIPIAGFAFAAACFAYALRADKAAVPQEGVLR